jgi:hypothetical protein
MIKANFEILLYYSDLLIFLKELKDLIADGSDLSPEELALRKEQLKRQQEVKFEVTLRFLKSSEILFIFSLHFNFSAIPWREQVTF